MFSNIQRSFSGSRVGTIAESLSWGFCVACGLSIAVSEYFLCASGKMTIKVK